MRRRRAPDASVSPEEAFARNKEWNAANPALRAENLRRADERDRVYREQYGLPPARWDQQFTRLTPTPIGNRVDDENWPIAAE